MPDIIPYLKAGFVLFIAVLCIVALFKTIGTIVRLFIMGIVIVLFLFFFGVPFLVPPLFSGVVCSGPVTAENIITRQIRTFPTCFPPFGWKPQPSLLR